MNICIITSVPVPPEEGIGAYVYNLAKNLMKKNNNVTIITRNSSLHTKVIHFDGIKVIRAPYIPIYPFHIHINGIFVNKILKILEHEIDIIHLHSPLVSPIKTSLPIITTIHTPMLIDTRQIELIGFRPIIERWMGRFVSMPIEVRLLKSADMVTTVANSVAHELSEYGLDISKIKVIGNGVDEKIFKMKKEYIKNDKYILFVGRLSYRKGLFDLIECCKYVCKRYTDVYFYIVGKGPLLNTLIKQVDTLGLRDKIRFKGYVNREELISLYQNATIFVMPSHYEGLPTVLLEAMACGLPVVATSVSGNLDVISHGKNGILVPPRNPKEMANAIISLLHDDEMRLRLGIAARQTIEKRYTWDIISDQFIQCYKLLLEGKP